MSLFTRSLPSTRFLSSIAYRSAISLQNIYPNSSVKLTTPTKPPESADGKFNGFIPFNELDVTYSKSSGPGGQNVNKVNTKVEIRFKVADASWINPTIRQKILEKLHNKITKEGFAIFRSDITRSQQLNLADCLEKIRSVVRSCEVEPVEPTPETQEKIRRRQERDTKLRLSLKRERSRVKEDRRGL